MENASHPQDAENTIGLTVMGLSNILIFALFCPLNTVIALLIHKKKALWNMVAYKIIFHMTVVSIIVLPSTLLLGVINLTEKSVRFPSLLIAASAMVSYFSPLLLCVMMAIQAFNRFVVISRLRLLDMPRLVQTFLWLSWSLVAILSVEMTFRGVIFFYFEKFHFYAIDNEEPENTAVFYTSMTFLLIGALFFVAALAHVILLRGITKRQDVYLLVQGLIPFLYLAFLKVLQRFLGSDGSVKSIMFSTAVRSVPILNAVVYLFLNRTLRMAFASFFPAKKIIPVLASIGRL